MFIMKCLFIFGGWFRYTSRAGNVMSSVDRSIWRRWLLSTGMILSNKEKTGKLCNTKSGRHAHVEDMSRARRSRCAFLGGFGGMLPQEIFCFQHGFLDF